MAQPRYLFRALSEETGEFVYGAYAERENRIIDQTGRFHKVKPHSGGIFTGFTNSRGNRVFSGDVFQVYDGVVALITDGNMYGPFPLKLIFYGNITDSKGHKHIHTISKQLEENDEGLIKSMIPIGNIVENEDWCQFKGKEGA